MKILRRLSNPYWWLTAAAVVFLAGVVIAVDANIVRAVAIESIALVVLAANAQHQATERNADSAAANSRRPILDVDELVDTIANRLEQRADARRTETVEPRRAEQVERVPTH